MFRPTKSIGEEMIFNSSAVNFGASLPAYCEKPVGVFALQDHAQEARVQLARRDFGRANVFGRIDRRHAGRDILGGADLGARAPLRADRLHGETMGQRDVVTDLVQFGRRQFETGRVDAPAITEVHEPSGFVDA